MTIECITRVYTIFMSCPKVTFILYLKFRALWALSSSSWGGLGTFGPYLLRVLWALPKVIGLGLWSLFVYSTVQYNTVQYSTVLR